MYLRLFTTPGSEETLPRRPRSPSRSSAAVLSLANRRAVVWEGRGATTRPRGAPESQVFFGYIVINIFSKIHLDMIMAFTTEEHYIIWIRSYMCRRVQTHKPVWRYTKVHLDFCLQFSTLIGQIGRVPLFGAGRRRYIRSRLFRLAVTVFWRALIASWRQKGKRKQVFPRAIRTTEMPSNPSPLTFRNNQIQILQTT